MNKHLTLHGNSIVCGLLEQCDTICLRPVGHWGPHVVQDASGRYFLMQTVCMPITFELAAPIAALARQDKNWTYSE